MMRSLPFLLLTATAVLSPLAQTPSNQDPKPEAGRVPTGQDKDHMAEDSKYDGIIATWMVVGSNNVVALATLAQQRATDPEVKTLAGKLIEDHRQMLTKLQPFGADVGAATGTFERSKPSQPEPASFGGGGDGFDHAALLEELGDQCQKTSRAELESKQGAEFDRCFVNMTVVGHVQANDMLTVFQRHASGKLKTTLTDSQKVVATHMQHAKELCKKLDEKASPAARVSTGK